MKKHIVGAIALISLSIAASAAVTPSAIPGIVVSESSCEDGYLITSTREGFGKIVSYDSCLSEGMVVSDAPVSLEGLANVTLNGVDYYFPAGYTTPTVAADNSCTGGFSTGANINCSSQNLGALSDGYLNLTSTATTLSFFRNQLTNVDALANLTTVGGDFYLISNQLTNVDGLANLTTMVGGLYLDGNSNLQDLSGLNNLESLGGIFRLNTRDYAIKLDANSYICQNFATKVKNENGLAYPNKSDICNP